MRLSQLETFITVARTQNFTRASQVCHLVQSTISHQISGLEEELGFALFERDSHTVTLTPAGKQFYRDIEEPLEMLRQAAQRAKAVAAGETGSLAVGVSGINQTERLACVRRFRERHPGVMISYCRMGNYNVLRKLDEGAFDISLIRLPDWLPPEYAASDVRLERIFLIAARSHPAAAFNHLTLREALRYPQLFARNGDLNEEENRRNFLRAFGVKEELPCKVYLTEDMDIMQLMLETGEGVALVPESVLGYEQKILKVIEISDPPPLISVGWVYRKDNPNPALHQFVMSLA